MNSVTSIIAASILLSPIVAHEREEPPEGAVSRTVLPNVKMPTMNEHSRSTLVCAMYALLPALGQQGWSIPRLEALTGYAFYFQMPEGGERVFDDDLDLRELTYVYPAAAKPLEAAAAHYDREVEFLTTIFDLCVAATKREPKAFTPDQRAEIRSLVTQALEEDRDAVGQIEAALKILETP